jgi:hypothetical protein
LAETGECEWFHVAAVYNRDLVDDDESQRLYVNGLEVADGGHSGMNPSDNDDPVGIGLWYMADGSISGDSDMPFIGRIDELRIMDIALGPAEFLLTPGPEWASNPRPVSGVRELDPNDPNLALVWDPGTKVAQHKVYFSTNYTDVCEGNPAALMATLPAESNSWPTDGNLRSTEARHGHGWVFRQSSSPGCLKPGMRLQTHILKSGIDSMRSRATMPGTLPATARTETSRLVVIRRHGSLWAANSAAASYLTTTPESTRSRMSCQVP